jgi:3D (Asp-Asp-Asp) domain-containing protein
MKKHNFKHYIVKYKKVYCLIIKNQFQLTKGDFNIISNLKNLTTKLVFSLSLAFVFSTATHVFASGTQYTVKSGDTLNKIAVQYGVTVQQIASKNNIADLNSIYVGQVFTIPAGTSASAGSSKYTVKSGDTLNKIAAQYGVTIQQIASKNNIADLNSIYVGQVFTIPSVVSTVSVSRGVASGQALRMKATAYTANEPGGIGGGSITATGTTVRRIADGYSTVAVDPTVIPLGTKLYVEGYGYAIAEDTGSLIKGNTIDVYFDTLSEANTWGVKYLNVYVLK